MVSHQSAVCLCVPNFQMMIVDLDIGTVVHLDPFYVKFQGQRSHKEKCSFCLALLAGYEVT